MNTQTNEQIDLFDDIEALPLNVQAILSKYSDAEATYINCENLVKELNKVGYTCEYYLNAEPFNLQKL